MPCLRAGHPGSAFHKDHDVLLPIGCLPPCRAAFDERALVRRGPCPDHGNVGPARQLHAQQRPPGRGDPGSPHARGHGDDLVQGRLGRRDAGQVRPRPFPRTLDVQGHREAPGRRILPDRAPRRRQRERLDLGRLHQLLPARAERAVADHDGVRGRPHDRPHPQGRERAARTRRRARRVQYARRQ